MEALWNRLVVAPTYRRSPSCCLSACWKSRSGPLPNRLTSPVWAVVARRVTMTTPRPSCIVLGGGGFLGTNLCRRLISTGHRVRAFGRRCLFPEALDRVDWYQGDFCDPAALAAAIETYEIVFHLVHTTTPHSANVDMAKDLQQNVISSLALFDVARALGVKRIVFVSSGGTIYGAPEQFPTPETAPGEPITA